MKASDKILLQISTVKQEIAKTKPRSERRLELELRLKGLVTRLLRKENQISRRGESLLKREVA